MNILKNDSKYIKAIETAFLYLFTVYAILGTNVFSYGTVIISFVMWPTFILGAIALVLRVINYKEYFKMPGLWALVLMLISIGISTLINYNYSLKQNIIQCFYWVLYFILMYTVNTAEDQGKTKKGLTVFFIFFVTYASFEVIGSLLTFIFDYSAKFVEPSGFEYYIGFSIGRLWGTFINPNTGAVTATAAIIILIYFFTVSKKVLYRIAFIVLMLLHYAYIVFSDSRTGAVSLGVSIGVYILIMLLYRLKAKKPLIRVLAVALSVIIGVGFVALPRKTTTVYNDIALLITSDKGEEGDDTNVIDRGYDLSGDISNRRFDAWKGAGELYADSIKTLTVGCSYGGFTQYAKENQPKNYLVNNDYGDFTTLDNEFFNIMCAQGTLGLLTAIIFVVFILIFVLKRIVKLKNEDKYDVPLIAVCLSIILYLAVSAMFRSAMFYHFSPPTVLFWVVLGRLVHILYCKSKVD